MTRWPPIASVGRSQLKLPYRNAALKAIRPRAVEDEPQDHGQSLASLKKHGNPPDVHSTCAALPRNKAAHKKAIERGHR